MAMVMGTAESPQTMFDAYMARPDDSFRWTRSELEGRDFVLDMTSQTWQGIPWRHNVRVTHPDRPAQGAIPTMVLFVTGDERPADYVVGRMLANTVGLPVATLFAVPNQPLWGMKEDDLIAHTLVQYLETGDETWPLLFPMAKSAIRAMDALQRETGIQRFVVAGASKRGWTSWLAAATSDPRVVGIAPLVIDNLDIPLQMRRQKALWGATSPMIVDYAERGLLDMLSEPKVQRVLESVDPFAYRDRIRVPVLMINGGNDPYWTVDALSVVWRRLPMPKWVVVVPNVGHGVEDFPFWLPSVRAFVRSLVGLDRMPSVTVDLLGSKVRLSGDRPVRARVWTNSREDHHFARGTWVAGPWLNPSPGDEVELVSAEKRALPMFHAAMVEMEFRDSLGDAFRLTTPVQVVRPLRRTGD